MTKPKATPTPEVVSRENAKRARMVEDFEADAGRALTDDIAKQLDEQRSCFDPASERQAWIEQGKRFEQDHADAQAASHAIRREPESGPGYVRLPIRERAEPFEYPASHATQGETEQKNHAVNADASANYAAYADGTPEVGNVPAMPAVEPAPCSPLPARGIKDYVAMVTQRLLKEKRWKEVEPVRDQMMRDCKKAMPDKEARQLWVYSELDRLYPKLPSVNDSDTISETPYLSPYVPTKPISESGQPSLPGLTDAGAIQGLAEIPEGWPTLPANASLGSELGWVQANRLRIVEERPGRATSVKLGQALSPAPSWAALGWLETSVRSYAKFVDVAAKAASGGDDDEGAVLRRERKSVDEVRALLDEMKQAEGTCPACGRPH
jgi:hypothetical protein